LLLISLLLIRTDLFSEALNQSLSLLLVLLFSGFLLAQILRLHDDHVLQLLHFPFQGLLLLSQLSPCLQFLVKKLLHHLSHLYLQFPIIIIRLLLLCSAEVAGFTWLTMLLA
jgi:hypothetical protein